MNKKSLFAALLLIATIGASAQKLSGNISPLKGQKEVNVVLDFSGVLVNKQSEESHIAFSTKDKTEEEKAQWLTEWNVKLRNDAYERLIVNLNKAANKKGFSVGNYPNAEYTIYVKVKNIDPGYFAGIMAKASYVWAEVDFVKTGTTAPLATAKYDKVLGKWSANVPYFVTRIAMAFGYLGDSIGSTITKNLK